MPGENETPLLEALLDSWDRNNTILVNLLHLVTEGAFAVKAAEGSPTVGQMFHHIHFVRLVFLAEDAPAFARDLPEEEWSSGTDKTLLKQMLLESAAAVREAVKAKLESHTGMELHYDHPVLLLQHMVWHEGYHHGQIKLALKLSGQPLNDDLAGPLTWGVWMDKSHG